MRLIFNTVIYRTYKIPKEKSKILVLIYCSVGQLPFFHDTFISLLYQSHLGSQESSASGFIKYFCYFKQTAPSQDLILTMWFRNVVQKHGYCMTNFQDIDTKDIHKGITTQDHSELQGGMSICHSLVSPGFSMTLKLDTLQPRLKINTSAQILPLLFSF